MKMNYILFCLSLMIIITSCSTEEEVNPIQNQKIDLRESIDFCMTTYNIQAFCNGEFIPPADVPVSPHHYGQKVCEAIKTVGSDYVNLQEVWCSEVAESIENCLSFAGYDGFVYDEESGLMSISRTEATTHEAVPFTGPEGGADHLKDKGFIHTSFDIMEGCTINIINTHMQADNSGFEDAVDFILDFTPFGLFTRHSSASENLIRKSQLSELKVYMQSQIDDCEITIVGGDFNIKKENDNGNITNEFTDLITLLQGQPSHLITSVPTNEAGDILDYFIISNYNQFSSDIETITNTTHYCSDPQEVTRYNIYETDNFDYPPHEYIVATFDTEDEANQAINEFNQDALESGDYYLTYDLIVDVTTVCNIVNDSDHEIVETCIENYDCDQDCP